LKLEHWKANKLANIRKKHWRTAKALNSAIPNKIIAKPGYASMLDYYLIVCEN
jgi:RNA-directed DNA polymerase